MDIAPFWFRRDLRLRDNAAAGGAARARAATLALYRAAGKADDAAAGAGKREVAGDIDDHLEETS
jgi:deoxyribodipyrimidine photolyase